MPRLEVTSVTKQFPAVLALDRVDLQFEPGEIHGLVGENGAGKSTLMKILSGIEQPTSGVVQIEGAVVTLTGVRHALSLGIAMIHQELDVIPELTVAENVFLGSEMRRGPFLDKRAMAEETQRLLNRVGASFSPAERVGELSIAEKQLVEIAKAVSHDAKVLIMDEPTAVLTDRETESLFALIRELSASGTTVIYISHRLAEVEHLCDRVSVLRDGRFIATLPRKEATQDRLASLMVGREIGDYFPAKKLLSQSEAVLEVHSVTVPGRVKDASLNLHKGEILGIAGLVGAGRTELAEAIIGARASQTGSVKIEGKTGKFNDIAGSVKAGIAYVSEDRKGTGLVLGMDVVENTTLANLKAYCTPLINQKAEEAAAMRRQKELDIKMGDPRADIAFLSGGNQQKVAVAKWLETGPKVLILDEPTRGVDVGAKREIYNLIQSLTAEGMGCIVISSELPEIVGLCHRVLVMREGKIVGELQGDDINEEAIMRLAAGVTTA